jgi:hypothetical protein
MAKRRKQTRLEELRQTAKERGLYVSTWSPGDGVTRYRFFDRPGNSYHGPDNGVCTELGLKNAYRFLHYGTCTRSRHRR